MIADTLWYKDGPASLRSEQLADRLSAIVRNGCPACSGISVRLRPNPQMVTIVFDREGWSPEQFAKWKSEGFEVLTYRKGVQSQWRKGFETHAGKVGGKQVEYCLAERRVKLSNGLVVREIRRKTEDGHQSSVITTNERLSTLEVAHRMFSRWQQENSPASEVGWAVRPLDFRNFRVD